MAANPEGVAIPPRFVTKFTVNRGTGCWEWHGTTADNGYGLFWDGSRHVRAHRFAYEAFLAPIPDGLVIDHLCRNRACVNPSHLEAVTQRVNVLRGVSGSATNAVKTQCHRGHPFTESNTYRRPNGKRECRECARAYELRRVRAC